MEMEKNYHSLATESFSRSWFNERELSFPENLNDMEHEQNFDFDVPFEASSYVSLVPADEIFSNGQIMPGFNDRTKAETLNSSASSVPPSLVSSYALETTPFLVSRNRFWFKWKWRKSSKGVFRKCFGLVRPLMRFSRKSIRVDDLERKVCEVQSLSNSVVASPRASSAYSNVEFSDMKTIGYKKADAYSYSGLKKARSWSGTAQEQLHFHLSPSRPSHSCCDVESSIHEAILYCKRSIEK